VGQHSKQGSGLARRLRGDARIHYWYDRRSSKGLLKEADSQGTDAVSVAADGIGERLVLFSTSSFRTRILR